MEPLFIMQCEVCHIKPQDDPKVMLACVGVDPVTQMPVFRCGDHVEKPETPPMLTPSP